MDSNTLNITNLKISTTISEFQNFVTWNFSLNNKPVTLEFLTSTKEGNKIYLNASLKLYDPLYVKYT